MSSAGQAIGGALGAVGGFMLGGFTGAMYGAQLGMMAGGYLDPPKGPNTEGPRLDDLTVQTATYGADIPRIYGTLAVTGNVFWLENNRLKESVTKTTRSNGGKGGGSKSTTTTYSYSATFAVGLCDCPSAPIVGIKRIWIAGRLWYDAGSSVHDAIIASNAAAQYFTLHTGAADQAPDERMQATLGVANTPAYRGLAYIVFRDLPLAEYSNSLMGAQVKAEVVCNGTLTPFHMLQIPLYTIAGNENWTCGCWNGSVFLLMSRGYTDDPEAAISEDGVNWSAHTIPMDGICSVAWNGRVFCAVGYTGDVNTCMTSPDGRVWALQTLPIYSSWSKIVSNGVGFVAFGGISIIHVIYSPDGITWVEGVLPTTGPGSYFPCTKDSLYVAIRSGTIIVSGNGAFWSVLGVLPSSSYDSLIWNGSQYLATGSYYDLVATSSDGVTWVTHAMPVATYYGKPIWIGNQYFRIGQTTAKGYTSPDGAIWTELPWTFTTYLEPRVFSGGKLVMYSTKGDAASVVWLITPGEILASTRPLLSSIVASEVAQSRLLTAADIDVSLLTQPVRGYRIAGIAAIRSAIEPLRGAWPFDVVQHGYTVRFKPRGGASVATIPAADLDARGSGDAPGVSITCVREMDSQLPRRVRVQFLDVDREYDVNEQADERQNTASVNVTSLDLAVVLTCGEAAGIAQVLLYLYWMERWDVSFALPPAYAALEPGDVVTVNADEASYTLRLTAITYAQDGRLECAAKFANAAIYTPTAVAVTGLVQAQTLTRVGDSQLMLLDVPLLIDSTDRPGFVAAMTGTLPGWTGGVIVRSDDGGQTWINLQAFAAPGATISYASNTIGAGRLDLIDTASALTVYLTAGTLSSVSESALLNGTNHFAYGVPGRWEIIAARTCTLQADGSYILTDLLRGRNGSEWACGLHAVGDALAALDTDSVNFVGVTLDSVGLARTYRGVTVGQDIASASDLAFTYAGVNLECLAPCYLNGNRHPTSNDWTLTWVRRTRVGGQWRDYVDATLGEATENYEVEIYTSSAYTTVKRTLTATTPTVAYTSAQQVSDFGSNQATLYVKVYQISASVGRGYPLTNSITR